MGNVCCTGRPHSSTDSHNTSNAKIKVPVDHIDDNLSKRDSKLEENTRLSALEINTVQNTESPVDKDQLSSESLEIEGKGTVNSRNFVSHRSEYGLYYSLILPETLTRLQQSQILEVLDKNKALIAQDDQEEIDGLAYVDVQKKSMFLMISTHALYLINPDKINEVFNRTRLEDIVFLMFTHDKSKLFIVVNGYRKDLILNCEKLEDIFKSIQQVAYESFQLYLPWFTLETESEFEYMKRKNLLEEKKYNAEKYQGFLKVLIEKGEFGESIVIDSNCYFNKAEKINGIFGMSEVAIYLLDSKYLLVHRISLEQIQEISVRGSGCISIKDFSSVFDIFIEVEFAERIKHAAADVGNIIVLASD